MDLRKFSLTELEKLLEQIPIEIARQESLPQEDEDDAKRRKISVWASIQELAQRQGLDLNKL